MFYFLKKPSEDTKNYIQKSVCSLYFFIPNPVWLLRQHTHKTLTVLSKLLYMHVCCWAWVPIVCLPICCRQQRERELINFSCSSLYSIKACLLLFVTAWPDILSFDDFAASDMTINNQVHKSKCLLPVLRLITFSLLQKWRWLVNTGMLAANSQTEWILSFKQNITINKSKKYRVMNLLSDCIQHRSYRSPRSPVRREQINTTLLTPQPTEREIISVLKTVSFTGQDTANYCMSLCKLCDLQARVKL